MTFKGSPLIPFFKHTYNKVRQTGALFRIKEAWKEKKAAFKCNSNEDLRPIPFSSIVSLIALLFFGIFIASLILLLEKIYHHRHRKTVNKKSRENK